MNETLSLLLALLAGLVLGAFFFGGLWLTVKKMVAVKMPALLFLGSFLFRTSITILGFYCIGGRNLSSLLICLIGFITARILVIRLTRSKGVKGAIKSL